MQSPIKLGEAIARTILADMRGEILPTFKGFAHSRYKNTNDITWQTNINDVTTSKIVYIVIFLLQAGD